MMTNTEYNCFIYIYLYICVGKNDRFQFFVLFCWVFFWGGGEGVAGMLLQAPFNKISVISWWSVLLVE